MSLKFGGCFMGGGALAYFELAAAKQLIEQGVVFDELAGSSGGAFNTALIAHNGIYEAIWNWQEIDGTADVLSQHWNKSEAWYDLDPIRRRLTQAIHGRPPRIPVTATVTDTWHKSVVYATPDTPVPGLDWVDSVIASGSIPSAIVGQGPQGRWQDGGLAENLPLRRLIDAGCDYIYCFLTTPYPLESGREERQGWPRIATSAFQAVRTLIHQNLVKDLRQCVLKNALTEFGYRRITIEIVAPAVPFETDILDFSAKSLKKVFETPVSRVVVS